MSFILGTWAIQCFTCENESCAQSHGHVVAQCDEGIYHCYKLKNAHHKVYKAGCLYGSCEKSHHSVHNCLKCSHDLCNHPSGHSQQAPPIGHGTHYNSAAGFSIFGSLILLFLTFA